MTVIATRDEIFSNVFKDEYDPSSGITREIVTVNITAGATLVQGTVLAKVAATGKFLVQDASLSTGAGLEADCIVIGKDELTPSVVCAPATDTKVLAPSTGTG